MAPAEASAARVAADPRPAREVDGDRRTRRTDGLVAVATAVVSLGLLLGLPYLDAVDPDSVGRRLASPGVGSSDWAATALGLLVQSAALLVARRAPRTVVLAAAVVPVLVIAGVSGGDLFGVAVLPVVVAVVLAALRVPLTRLWPSAVGAAVLVAAGTAGNWIKLNGALSGHSLAEALVGALPQGVTQAIGAVGLPLVGALVVRSRREVRAARDAELVARTAEASAVVREQDARVDAAVSRERAAMARELHDIAAHHLSGIALMSAVIDRQIDTDPLAAHEGVRQVREQSTAVLEDLRRLVGLLRDDAPAERAVETVAGIVDLVERARYRSDVRLEVLPGEHPLSDGIGPLAQLAAYRTAQEALANAALHAPGAVVTVTIDDRAADHLELHVENTAPLDPSARAGQGDPVPGSAAAGGNGLRGMRERAELVGARLQTGPTADGGWSVTLGLGRQAAEVSP
ncbi:sensor histidine kinase [Curtobacterium sp. SGAir0471]|uniref:sensor histidine kinase n=1 Tax=Curtobacterium sp. SGAir0471 TaxID=2070337 RepID=UPI0010CD431F|nr:histidine kinase [Curtobacterium sp. SGAir0471]QCR43713.1 sensor histidine kinase [Curtobacterium sp. SGAir0471]